MKCPAIRCIWYGRSSAAPDDDRHGADPARQESTSRPAHQKQRDRRHPCQKCRRPQVRLDQHQSRRRRRSAPPRSSSRSPRRTRRSGRTVRRVRRTLSRPQQTNSGIVSFANSDGCSDIDPKRNHRWAPFTRCPTPGTSTSTSSSGRGGEQPRSGPPPERRRQQSGDASRSRPPRPEMSHAAQIDFVRRARPRRDARAVDHQHAHAQQDAGQRDQQYDAIARPTYR